MASVYRHRTFLLPAELCPQLRIIAAQRQTTVIAVIWQAIAQLERSFQLEIAFGQATEQVIGWSMMLPIELDELLLRCSGEFTVTPDELVCQAIGMLPAHV